MNLLRSPLLALEGAARRLWRSLDQPAVARAAIWLVPLLFGLLSLARGQDDNWDLHNYHFYNPYALMNGKIGYDLAPGQWQSYFNPTLDLLYYGLNRVLPAPAVGFLMGWLHGLNFVLLLGVARLLLDRGAHRLALLLALAGCLGPGFLSELGNTMGDNLTSLFVLGALLLLLQAWSRLASGKALPVALLAGLVMGAGCGLKLTNATYAVALCLALLGVRGGLARRLRAAFVFGVGVLGGIAVTAGHWYWRMWQVFGNPLFPQFNDRFHAALAAPIGIGDTGWLPKGWAERLLWPFIFTLHPQRVIEIPMTQLIWPMLYLAFLALGVRSLRAAILGQLPALTPRRQRIGFLLTFCALAYVGWLNLFGIYRYLVPLELLAPLALWLVAHRLMPAAVARGVAGYALLLAAVAIWPVSNWGHAGWARTAAHADVPPIDAPAQSMVITVQGDPPLGWMVQFFPRALAFVSLGSGFPESPAFARRVADMMAARSGPFYVMLTASGAEPAQAPPEQRPAALQHQAELVRRAREILDRYGIVLHDDSCQIYSAWVGSSRQPYQLCLVTPPTPPKAGVRSGNAP